ncbi:hypothetical protein [Halobellus rubicundus]|uniref:Uncharacterized protein n=1 Tax=Halobellus rubicundus TaxID=2996466 RepID=A0ABD5MGE6_9EURY
MGRSIEITGNSLIYLFYIVSLAGLVAILGTVVFPLEDPGSAALAVLLVSLTAVGIIGFWRRVTDRDGEHLGTVEDLAYDPIAYPGQAAKHNWAKAIRRLRVDGEEDDD